MAVPVICSIFIVGLLSTLGEFAGRFSDFGF